MIIKLIFPIIIYLILFIISYLIFRLINYSAVKRRIQREKELYNLSLSKQISAEPEDVELSKKYDQAAIILQNRKRKKIIINKVCIYLSLFAFFLSGIILFISQTFVILIVDQLFIIYSIAGFCSFYFSFALLTEKK
jgi:hypothetical protein